MGRTVCCATVAGCTATGVACAPAGFPAPAGDRPRSGTPRRPLECAVQRFEHRHAVVEQHVIVRIQRLKAIDERANRARFRCTKSRVLQIEIVDDGGDALDGAIVDQQSVRQHFERAPLSAMGELHAEHVERNGIAGSRRIGRSQNEPWGR